LPKGVELALGIDRAASLEQLLRQTDTLSIHTPLTTRDPGVCWYAELGLLHSQPALSCFAPARFASVRSGLRKGLRSRHSLAA